MLNEPASSREERPVFQAPSLQLPQEDNLYRDIRQMVETVLNIETEVHQREEDNYRRTGVPLFAPDNRLTATFEGRLKIDSETAYDQLDELLKSVDHFPIFQLVKGKHVVHAMSGRINPQPRPWWPNLLLFIATLFSVLLIGFNTAVSEIAFVNQAEAERVLANLPGELWRGLPYAISILLILGSHELGHYFAARRHKVAVTLPYFIPLPPPFGLFGTLGAFIQLRQPMKNRKVLLDVGAAGPLTGLLFAIPILLIGLATSVVGPPPSGGYITEGNSILYALAKIMTFGKFLPDGTEDVMLNQLAWAGWTGLLVTALNLIPIGQLDGGHILYSIIGERARIFYIPLVIAMFILALITQVWMLWVILLLIFGRVYATPLDTITPLDRPRRAVAILALVIFALIFVPVPLTENSDLPRREAPSTSVQAAPPAAETTTLIHFP
jgi:Zn-dependent protease